MTGLAQFVAMSTSSPVVQVHEHIAHLQKRSPMWKSKSKSRASGGSESHHPAGAEESIQIDGKDGLLLEKPDYKRGILPMSYYDERYGFYLNQHQKMRTSRFRSKSIALRKYLDDKIAHYQTRLLA